jgi:hypothetical protein
MMLIKTSIFTGEDTCPGVVGMKDDDFERLVESIRGGGADQIRQVKAQPYS